MYRKELVISNGTHIMTEKQNEEESPRFCWTDLISIMNLNLNNSDENIHSAVFYFNLNWVENLFSLIKYKKMRFRKSIEK